MRILDGTKSLLITLGAVTLFGLTGCTGGSQTASPTTHTAKAPDFPTSVPDDASFDPSSPSNLAEGLKTLGVEISLPKIHDPDTTKWLSVEKMKDDSYVPEAEGWDPHPSFGVELKDDPHEMLAFDATSSQDDLQTACQSRLQDLLGTETIQLKRAAQPVDGYPALHASIKQQDKTVAAYCIESPLVNATDQGDERAYISAIVQSSSRDAAEGLLSGVTGAWKWVQLPDDYKQDPEMKIRTEPPSFTPSPNSSASPSPTDSTDPGVQDPNNLGDVPSDAGASDDPYSDLTGDELIDSISTDYNCDNEAKESEPSRPFGEMGARLFTCESTYTTVSGSTLSNTLEILYLADQDDSDIIQEWTNEEKEIAGLSCTHGAHIGVCGADSDAVNFPAR